MSADNLYNDGIKLIEKREYEQAENQLLLAKDEYSKNGNRIGEGNCLKNIGRIYYLTKYLKEAIRNYKEAAQIYKTINCQEDELFCLLELSDLKLLKNLTVEAIRSYKKALKLAQTLSDRENEIKILINIGFTYKLYNNIDFSNDYYLKAIEIIKKFRDISPFYKSFLYLGDKFLYLEKNYEAIEYYNEIHRVLDLHKLLLGDFENFSELKNMVKQKLDNLNEKRKLEKTIDLLKQRVRIEGLDEDLIQLSEIEKLLWKKEAPSIMDLFQNEWEIIYEIEKKVRELRENRKIMKEIRSNLLLTELDELIRRKIIIEELNEGRRVNRTYRPFAPSFEGDFWKERKPIEDPETLMSSTVIPIWLLKDLLKRNSRYNRTCEGKLFSNDMRKFNSGIIYYRTASGIFGKKIMDKIYRSPTIDEFAIEYWRIKLNIKYEENGAVLKKESETRISLSKVSNLLKFEDLQVYKSCSTFYRSLINLINRFNSDKKLFEFTFDIGYIDLDSFLTCLEQDFGNKGGILITEFARSQMRFRYYSNDILREWSLTNRNKDARLRIYT